MWRLGDECCRGVEVGVDNDALPNYSCFYDEGPACCYGVKEWRRYGWIGSVFRSRFGTR